MHSQKRELPLQDPWFPLRYGSHAVPATALARFPQQLGASSWKRVAVTTHWFKLQRLPSSVHSPGGVILNFRGISGGKKTHPLSNFSGEAKPRRQGFKGVQQKSREIFACDTDILGNSGGSSRHPGPNVCRKIQGKLGGNQRSREEGPGDYKHPSWAYKLKNP